MPMSEWIKSLREIVGHDLIANVGAAAIVLNDEGQILLQQRTDNHLWGIPGGAIEPSEHPAEAALREVYEETGIIAEAIQLVGVFGGGGQQIVTYPNGDVTAYVSMTFLCRAVGGTLTPDPAESKDARWFDIDQMPENFVPTHHRRINAWQSGNMPYFAVPDIPFELSQGQYLRDIRQKIGSRMVMLSGCAMFVFNDEGQLLVQQRSDNHIWNVPSGSYEVGEEPAETAIRETYEETGLWVRPTRLVGVYGGAEEIVTYPHGDQVAYITMVFICEVVGGTLSAECDESLDVKFVSTDNLPEPFHPLHRAQLEHVKNRTDPYFYTSSKS